MSYTSTIVHTFVCDRCKKVQDGDNLNWWFIDVGVRNREETLSHSSTYDLCDECFELFRTRFIKKEE